MDIIFGLFNETVVQSFIKLCLSIDSIIYSIISYLYSIFITIAEARLFTSETIRPFIDRLYLIVGIIALFFVAYTFLSIIINPDKLANGKFTPSKGIKNIIFAILGITFIPAIFNFAYAVQGSMLNQKVISKIFTTQTEVLFDENEDNLVDFGVSLFESSFYLTNSNGDFQSECQSGVPEATCCYLDADVSAREYNNVAVFTSCAQYVGTSDSNGGSIKYNYILSGIIGVIVVYVFLVYCIDIALRTIKLCFLQIVSPFPCLLLMVPGQEKVFKTWLKETLKTFFEVFLKIFIVVFGVYIIQLVKIWIETNKEQVFPNTSWDVIIFARLFIFLGVIMFIRKAPKLIEDLFGIKTDKGSFSIRKRFDESGITALAGGIGGAIAGAYSSIQGAKARGGNTKLAAASGAFHGARLGGKAGWDGSMTGIGDAYNYGWANQQAWARMDKNRGYLANQILVSGEMLRDNFGIQSHYDDLRDKARIEHDVITSANDREMQAIDKEYNEQAKRLDEKYQFNARSAANARFMTIANKSNDTAKSEVYKDGYKETTTAWVPVHAKRDVLDKYGTKIGEESYFTLEEQEVSASQFSRIKETLSDAIAHGYFIGAGEETAILDQLDSAEKRLKIDYDTNTLISEKRDNKELETVEAKRAAREKYTADFIENMKTLKHWNEEENRFVEYGELETEKQEALQTLWTSAAEARFRDITETRVSDFKTNLEHASELHEILDLASIASNEKGDRDFVKDAAGQYYDKTENKFKIDEAVAKISVDTDKIISGLDIQSAIKAVKYKNVNGEKDSVYRTEEASINVSGKKTNMAQAQHIKQSLVEANKKADKDLEDKMLSLKTDEQTAEAARKIGKYRSHKSDSGKK